MQAQVYKIHSDFYYVKDFKHNSFTCKLRELLKKQKTDIRVGDYVELSKDNNFITTLLKRNNSLEKPKVSNIDLAVVVCALKEPELDFIQLNRYLIYLKYHNIDTIICFNKEDLINDINSKANEINQIYTNLGYKTFFISAKKSLDMEEFKKYIQNKTIVLCGLSGVGKSTLTNSLIPDINLKTNNVSIKTQKGTHTTRHCEILEYNNYKIMDTPGFSCLKFDFILPEKLIELFDEIKLYAKECKYSDCLHNINNDKICNVAKNIDKIDKSRYESYLCFLKEAIEYKEKISKKSIKNEKNIKKTGNKIITKISKKKRSLSRKTEKQRIEDING